MAWKFDGATPVYLQIAENIRARVIAGEWKPGARLPSVRELALDASVNPNTMQRALTSLEEERLVYAESTAGRFVTDDAEIIRQARMREAEDLARDFLRRGRALGFTDLELTSCLNDALQAERGEKHD